jgi:hypothetical protein
MSEHHPYEIQAGRRAIDEISRDCDTKIRREPADGMYNIEKFQRSEDKKSIKGSTSHEGFMRVEKEYVNGV